VVAPNSRSRSGVSAASASTFVASYCIETLELLLLLLLSPLPSLMPPLVLLPVGVGVSTATAVVAAEVAATLIALPVPSEPARPDTAAAAAASGPVRTYFIIIDDFCRVGGGVKREKTTM